MRKIILPILLMIYIIFPASVSAQDFDKQEKAIRRLSNAIQGIWLETGNPSEDNFLHQVRMTDSSLLSHFGDNTIRIYIISDNPVVLICTPDGQQALFEDVPCTPQIEKRRYQQISSCSPTLNPANFCR